MALQNEIVAWASTRLAWQQQALYQLATGGPEPDPASIARGLAEGKEYTPQTLAEADLPGETSSGVCVRLLSVSLVKCVNAIRNGECLTFSPAGITVVYGDNASGKSGYARILKQVVRARVREDVLPDVFQDQSPDCPSALITYDVSGAEQRSIWSQTQNPGLRGVGFYDDACGAAYITRETAVTYRPSMLVVFDRLIDLCDAVRSHLDDMLADNDRVKIMLPTVPEGTGTSTFLNKLSAATTMAEIDVACAIPEGIDATIKTLADEEVRLRATDPLRERVRLMGLGEKIALLDDHLATLQTALSDDVDRQLAAAQALAADHRAAATIASSASFRGEPLSGVGSTMWRAMWEAARRYAEAEAYPGREFPGTGANDRCVLCQQKLSDEANDRLYRFHRFMRDDTERQAIESQRRVEEIVERLARIDVEAANVVVALATLEGSDPDLTLRCRAVLSAFVSRKDALVQRTRGGQVVIPAVPHLPSGDLLTARVDATERAAALTGQRDFAASVSEVAGKRAELEAQRTANAARHAIEGEVRRLSARAKIEAARKQTDTKIITRKSTDLSSDFVTDVVRDQFTRESHDLKLHRVTLAYPGGKKGQLMQKPSLLAAKQAAEIASVLSEGEQTALGLAGFLTETHFDNTKSAIVLDDPVTSLDHVRRDSVARRLCAFARDRQVIVFTHDLTFVGDLRKAAEEANVEFTPRAVERQPDGTVGVCRDQYPWKAKDSKERLAHLRVDLQRIERECSGWDEATYEREVADWAGKLSETWERLINLEVVSKVVERGTFEVRPRMFRALVYISEKDNNEFQQSYGRCTTWLRRHDKSPDRNCVAPSTSEMREEWELVHSWWDRVRRYGNDG